MSQVRICKYGCFRELGKFDMKLNKYLELDGTVHSKERCQELKSKQAVNDWANNNDKPKQENGHNDISLEIVLKKLESIGITLDLNKLRNVTNGDKK